MSEQLDRLVRGSRWSDDQARESLQAIVETLSRVTGFEVVGVSGIRDDGYLHVLALTGPDEARAVLLDSLAPAAPLLEALGAADVWGTLQFLPHDRHGLDIGRWGWLSDDREHVAPGQWHPADLLVTVLRTADGRPLATIGLDVPRDGLVPDGEQRLMVETFVAQAVPAVAAILERELLAEQIRLASAAATIVRRASGSKSPAEVVAECGAAILEGFRAQSLWVKLSGEAARAVYDQAPVAPPEQLEALLARYAEAAWARQSVGVFAPDRPPPAPATEHEVATVLAFLDGTEAGSLLVIPLGAGPEHLGLLALTRGSDGAEWSEGECTVAVDIGRDLGRTLANARNFEREHRLVQELQELADYKTRLVATVSHELRTPLTSVVGFAEMLSSAPELSERSRAALDAIRRGSVRLSRVVEDLLVLHRAADTDLVPTQPVDLGAMVAEAIELIARTAGQRRIDLRLSLPATAALVDGIPHELEHLPTNLVGNAVKYSEDGGSVAVTLEIADDELVLTCADTGIGIADADQEHVFEEFFRSTDPVAARRFGTGLGLSIVRRIVERHRGSIELDSALGAGSTFRVRLPRSAG